MSKVGESSMIPPSSKSKEKSPDVEEITKRLKELEVLLEEKNKLLAKKNLPPEGHVCGLCLEIPSIPISFQAFPRNGTRKETSKLRTCPYSKVNPTCLSCGRAHIIQATKANRKSVRCLGNCCIIPVNDGVPIRKKYGDPDRGDDDPPHLALYSTMDAHGIGDTVCRRCNKDCGSILDLVKHNRSDCTQKKEKCDVCKLMILNNQFEAHKQNCYRFCFHCGVDGPKLRMEGKIPYDIEENSPHFCENKVLRSNKFGFCKHPDCSKKLNIFSIRKGEHRNCTVISKAETRSCK